MRAAALLQVARGGLTTSADDPLATFGDARRRAAERVRELEEEFAAISSLPNEDEYEELYEAVEDELEQAEDELGSLDALLRLTEDDEEAARDLGLLAQ